MMTFKIMLDAGHGINTSGKRSPDGMREFEFNVKVAEYMKQELEQYEGVKVYMAHDHPTGNRDVPLQERTDKANRLNVDVYFSIHANAYKGVMGNHGGIEIFVYTTKPKEATNLAQVVQSNLVKATKLRNRGVKTANFHVLRETKMTAVLVEHGFMDSTTDLPKLKSDSFRRLCAKTNVESLVQFFKLKKKPKPQPKPSTGKTMYRVVTGSFADKTNAEKRMAELKKAGFDSFIIAEKI